MVSSQTAFIAGGSRGLGKELGKQLASRGLNIVMFARNKAVLEDAQVEISTTKTHPQQTIRSVSVDLTDTAEVDLAIRECGVIPDFVYCVAGGSALEMGFFADLTAHQLDRCIRNNYLSAAYFSHSCLKLWLAGQVQTSTRHIVFVCSTAAFVAIPGYAAYTPAKAAVRALADTLRQELLLYGGKDRFQVHCSFPGTFISDGFIHEQQYKPELTMVLEETEETLEHLKTTRQSAGEVATSIIDSVDRGHFAITHDLQGALLLNNMRGPTPRDHWLRDIILGCVASVAWPFYRRMFDRKTEEYGRKMKAGG